MWINYLEFTKSSRYPHDCINKFYRSFITTVISFLFLLISYLLVSTETEKMANYSKSGKTQQTNRHKFKTINYWLSDAWIRNAFHS